MIDPGSSNFYARLRRRIGERYRAMRRLVAPSALDRYFRPVVARERRALRQARTENGPSSVGAETPLVSVTIATWNRGGLLAERTIPSVLAQTYDHFEVVIVGDHCTDDTESLIRKIGDPRVRWVNLPKRGDYPVEERARWQVAGTLPLNEGLRLARGEWIAQLDDDDVFTEDHIEVLMRHARKKNLELACGVARREVEPSVWENKGGPGWPGGLSVFSASLTRSYLKLFTYDIEAWRVRMPGDKHRLNRMLKAGVRMGFVNRVVLLSPMRPGQTTFDERAEDREKLSGTSRGVENAPPGAEAVRS